MTDRELLELAAKAAGIEITPHPNAKIARNLVFTAGGKNWNPLTDDGDALRLAVKLELEMYFGDDEDGTSVHVGYAAAPDSAAMVRYCIQRDADPCAATRRAIVRAAAEIGKGVAQSVGDDLPEDDYYKSMAEAEEIEEANGAVVARGKRDIGPLAPVKIWSDKNDNGKTRIWRQYKGGEPFLYIEINYDYRHTSNVAHLVLARRIVEMLGGCK